MENKQYTEELLREFFVFRGFTSTIQAFETELPVTTNIVRNFQVDKILDLIFRVYVPRYRADKLVSLLNFFKQCFYSPSDVVLFSTLLKLELSVLLYYVVHALQSGRQDKVVEFFSENDNYLLQKREDWTPWFAILYLKNPNLDPQFGVYFSKDWFDALLLSFRNFLSEIFNGSRIPALLKISTVKNTVRRLKNDIKQLNHNLSQLQALLEVKEAEISHLRSIATPSLETSIVEEKGLSNETLLKDNGSNLPVMDFQETTTGNLSYPGRRITSANGSDASDSARVPKESTSSRLRAVSRSLNKISIRNNESEEALQILQAGEILREEDFPEVKVDFQETFLGHTSPISRCRFSASGMNIASASVDGTVRIWTNDSSTPTSRNATL